MVSNSRPVVAMCAWQDFNYANDGGNFRDVWTPRDEPPTPCRASLGARILTVWLPAGAVIRCRLRRVWREGGPAGPMQDSYTHVYGSHDRMTRRRIQIALKEYPSA